VDRLAGWSIQRAINLSAPAPTTPSSLGSPTHLEVLGAPASEAIYVVGVSRENLDGRPKAKTQP
jgi:hypothetical protein